MKSAVDHEPWEPSEEKFRQVGDQIDQAPTYKEKLQLFHDSFGVDLSDVIAILDSFSFPFVKRSSDADAKKNHFNKHFHYTQITFSQRLSKERHELKVSVFPSSDEEWGTFNRFVIKTFFTSLEKRKEAIERTLGSVPEKDVYLAAQIKKIEGLFSDKRTFSVPFHQEYYEINVTDPERTDYLNRWYPTFERAFKMAREEGFIIDVNRYIEITELYFSHLGTVYAFLLGYLKTALATIKAGGEIESSAKSGDSRDKNKEFTVARQVLAIHYLLKANGINPIDQPAEVSKFIQFVTGREVLAKRIQDTTIYKKVKSPFKLNDEELLKDLTFISQFFQSMGLLEIVDAVNKEIQNCKVGNPR